MKTSQKIKKLEAAFKNSFNAASAGTFSPNWQAELLERLNLSKTFNFPRRINNKFENRIWKLVWISFAVSALAAVFVAVYMNMQPDNFEQDLNNAICSDTAMNY